MIMYMKKYTVRKRHTKRKRRENKRKRKGGNTITNKFSDWKTAALAKFQSVRPSINKTVDINFYVVNDGKLEIISYDDIIDKIKNMYDNNDILGDLYMLNDNIRGLEPSVRAHIITVLFENIPKPFTKDEQQTRYNDANTIYKGFADVCLRKDDPVCVKENLDKANKILAKYNLGV